jgi:hypothetical protein
MTIAVREVTPEEVAAFKRNGWAHLPRLISESDALTLRERATARLGVHADGDPDIDKRFDIWSSYVDFGRKIDPVFWSVSTHKNIGRNASILLGRNSSIRLLSELLAVKVPRRFAGDKVVEGSAPTGWHQDWFTRGVDRTTLTTWMALNDIPPERGSMRFLNGSHRLGALGVSAHEAVAFGAPDEPELPQRWPDLADCPVSAPLHLRPGDATVHNAFVVHAAPANTTDEPRWVYLMGLYPGDAVYNGQPLSQFAGTNLKFGQVIDCPQFPVIYDPASK